MLIFLLLVTLISLRLSPVAVPAPAVQLFSALPASHTKIQFNNKLKDTKADNIMIYSNFYGGAGVGVGDINNDGLPDLYFAGNQVADKLYLNKGGLVFEDITKKAGIAEDGGWSSGVLFGDVNQDGFQDIYVTRELYDDDPELRRNKLYLNQGDNTFKEQAAAYGIDDNQRTRHATFLDYDKDGDLDLFLLNQPPNPGEYSSFKKTELIKDEYSARLYQLNGQKYKDVTVEAGLKKTGFPNSVTASDLNGDGWTDLYVANDFWIGDWYYINNGDGTFTDKIHDNLRHTSFSSMGVDAGDINNDGQLDMIIVDMVAEDNYRLKANMSGMNPAAFWKVVDEGGHYQYMFNTLQLNVGEGQFSDVAQLGNVASTDWSWSALFADLDNDGWKDIYITNGLMRDIRNNDAVKAFKKYVESAIHDYLQEHPEPGEISIWDIVDIEKALELTPSQKLSNYVFKNNGDLTFSQKMDEWGLDQETFSNGAAYADLDLDGDLDLVVNNVNDKALVYQNHTIEKGGGNFLRIIPTVQSKVVSEMGTKVWIETAAGPQFQEITGVRGMYSTSESVAHFGLGTRTTVDKIKIRWPDGKEVVMENVQANQVLTVDHAQAAHPAKADSRPSTPYLQDISQQVGIEFQHRENEFDDYRMQVLLPHKMSAMGPALAVADVNGDGLDDFFVGGAAGQAAGLFVQAPDGAFEPIAQETFQAHKIREDVGAVFFDLENDGDPDLYVVSGGNEFNPSSTSYQDRLYLNDGNGKFSDATQRLPAFISSGSKVLPFDIDQDGDTDLFVAGRHVPWAYPLPASSYLLINNDGQFEDQTAVWAPELQEIGMVNDAQWLDYDRDGLTDLCLVGEWMVPTLLKNDGKSLKKVEDIEAFNQARGWWFSLEAADVDGDGDQDLIAGNLGLNYKYKASPTEPFEVYYYDFDDNGSEDVVLTYYNHGQVFPLRGRQCSSEQMPILKEKFPNYDLFASSDVFDIYGEQKLQNALHYEATDFASTYFENLGNGQFKAHPLPKLAQLSSINDILIEDFNNDQAPDILIAGNLYHAEVETARNDAGYGLLMLAEGNGEFTPLPAAESGLFIPREVKYLAKINYRKNDCILVASNNDHLRILKKSNKHQTK